MTSKDLEEVSRLAAVDALAADTISALETEGVKFPTEDSIESSKQVIRNALSLYIKHIKSFYHINETRSTPVR